MRTVLSARRRGVVFEGGGWFVSLRGWGSKLQTKPKPPRETKNIERGRVDFTGVWERQLAATIKYQLFMNEPETCATTTFAPHGIDRGTGETSLRINKGIACTKGLQELHRHPHHGARGAETLAAAALALSRQPPLPHFVSTPLHPLDTIYSRYQQSPVFPVVLHPVAPSSRWQRIPVVAVSVLIACSSLRWLLAALPVVGLPLPVVALPLPVVVSLILVGNDYRLNCLAVPVGCSSRLRWFAHWSSRRWTHLCLYNVSAPAALPVGCLSPIVDYRLNCLAVPAHCSSPRRTSDTQHPHSIILQLSLTASKTLLLGVAQKSGFQETHFLGRTAPGVPALPLYRYKATIG